MVNRLTVNHTGNQIQLFWQRGNSVARATEPVNFSHPFNTEVLAEIRWYLEEYLAFPYGIEPDKASALEQKLQGWGEALFNLIFCSNEKGRQFFQEATRDGLQQCELGISSEDPQLLNLPWELLYCSDYQFLAPSLAGIYRSLESFAVRADMKPLPQDRLNILLVIARPYGETDVSFQTIARPLLQSLEPISNRVNLKVLRPPSFEQLERELNANKGFYHIVHFDGHGDFDPNSVGFQYSFGEAGQGVLVFENVDGSPQIVTAAQIAQSLTDCQVPLFVLNACRSAQEGNGSFSSVATRLVSLGAKSVVAMSYNVYVVAAKHFIGRLYEQLAIGSSVQVAVAAGRRELLNKPMRYSPKGDLRLQDWMVPILYQQEDHIPFIPTSEEIPDLDTFLDEADAISLIDFPDEGQFGFIGRDYDTLRLERAFRNHNFVLLRGLAGVGKTELACGFGRWFVQTKGVQASYFASFEQGRGISQVIYQVGRSVWGDKFSQFSDDQQEAAVIKYLKQTPCLLIWDNFESAAEFSDGNDGLCSPEEKQALTCFLKALRGGKSFILITSRREEKWLDINYQLLEISGLVRPDAEALGNKILDTAGVNRRQLPPEYLELFDLLGGHPLSLRVVLPHLKTQSPNQLIDALRRGLDTFVGKFEEGRDKSLIVSLDYSFNFLSERTKKHLPFLGLFCERVTIDTLSIFSNGYLNHDMDQAIGSKELYYKTFGEILNKEDWYLILNEGVNAGLLIRYHPSIYTFHPALSWYLRRVLENNINSNISKSLQQKLLFLYAIHATSFNLEDHNNSEGSVVVLLVEESNFIYNMELAITYNDYINTQLIFRTLAYLYDRLGSWEKSRILRQKLLNKIGYNLSEVKAKGDNALDLWIILKGLEAEENYTKRDLDKAQKIHELILSELLQKNNTSKNSDIAIAYQHLGIIKRAKQDFKCANIYFKSALNIYKKLKDNWRGGTIYYELGQTSQAEKKFKKSLSWFKKAYSIFENKDNYRFAGVCSGIGSSLRLQGNFKEALDYLNQALNIFEAISNAEKSTGCYHEIGCIYQFHEDFDTARYYYNQAIEIYENEQDYYNASDEYQSLGEIAKKQRKWSDAEAYFEKALKIRVDSEDWFKVAATLEQLAELLEDQNNFNQATEFYINLLMIDRKYNTNNIPEVLRTDIQSLKRMLQSIGEAQFSVIWKKVTSSEFAGEIRDVIIKDD